MRHRTPYSLSMTCSQCGAELVPGKRFCPQCGSLAAFGCPSCGGSMEADFRYCPACGAAVTEQTPDQPDSKRNRTALRPAGAERSTVSPKADGERKLVTVLFCDLVGSTAIAEMLDPEEYHDLLERYIELVLREIHRLGGLVNQLAGDGVMALFGAPVAHEDAPERAVRAAVAIRGALSRLGENLKERPAAELRVRIGIHTGPVMVGTIGNALKMDYTAIGDTTNLASRLQTLAKPGTILMSESTQRLVRGVFHVRHVGQLTVKGKREPVTAYEVRCLAETATPMAIAAARGLTPLVGRKGELGQLRACYQRLSDNLAQLVAVVGEAGSGKSRLLYEFKKTLANETIVIFEARCSSLSQTVPFAAITEMLKHYFAIGSRDSSDRICEKVSERLKQLHSSVERLWPFLCRLLSVPAESPADLPASELKREMFEAVAGLVVAISRHAPVVMIIEDLQWMDDSSRELLELAMARLGTEPVMVMVSHRPDYRLVWATNAAFTQVNLRPLSESEAMEMIRAAAGGPLPAEMERLILARAEGNPFFTEEMTRALLEEGVIVQSDAGLELSRPAEQIRIPDTIQELIAARLDRLGKGTKRVAQVASVLGRQFRREQLEKLLEGEEISLTGELDELQRRGIIHSNQLVGDDEFRFGESLTQEVAYEGLLLKERRRLHEKVALLLEGDQSQTGAERSAVVAHHFSRSDNSGRALAALLRAAGEAEQVPSYPAAAALYQEAWRTAERLLDAARQNVENDSKLKRQALLAASGLCRMPVLYSSVKLPEAELAARRGRELARELNDAEALANLYSLHGMIMIMRGERERFAEGLALVEEGHATALQAGLSLAAISVSRGLAWNYVLDGRFTLAARTIGWAVVELEELGHREKRTDLYLGARWLRDTVNCHSDNLEEALSGAAVTYEMALQTSNRTVQSSAAGTVAQVNFVRGRYEEARDWADRSLEVAEAIGLAGAIRTSASIALTSRIELGDRAGAAHLVTLLDKALADGGDVALNCWIVIEALVTAGELERANRLAAVFSRAGGELRQALAATARGKVMFSLGPRHWEQADRCYSQAIALAQGLGARSTLAVAAIGAGRLAVARGDKETGRPHLEQAVRISRELGLGRYLAQAEQLLAQGTGELSASQTTP